MIVSTENQKASLSVVIPVYNEEKTLADIIHKVLELPQILAISIVDDCSKDKSPEIAKALAEKHSRIH